MKERKETSGDFILKLTAAERKKLKLIAVERNTTMQSLVRHLIQTNKTIESI
jgi:hypothetical protein